MLAGLCFHFLHFISHKVGKIGFRSKCFTCLVCVHDCSYTNGSNDGLSGEISSCEMIWSQPMILLSYTPQEMMVCDVLPGYNKFALLVRHC